jgi:hypothetical protein
MQAIRIRDQGLRDGRFENPHQQVATSKNILMSQAIPICILGYAILI